MIQFAYTIMYVQDVEKTLCFYEQAFAFSRKFLTPDNSYGELVTGQTTLSFAATTLGNSNFSGGFLESDVNKQPFGIEIGFTTDNVAQTLQSAIQAGAMLVSAPTTKPWGQIVAYVRDLNGFLIEICTPMV